MNIEKNALKLVAHGELRCAGNGDQYERERSPYCGIVIGSGEGFIERNPEHDKYGSFHCLCCYKQFFQR